MTSNNLFDDDLTDSQWYYCLDHQTVEPRDGCRNEVRLGPYATQEEAAAALENVEKRNQAWDEDPAWNDEE